MVSGIPGFSGRPPARAAGVGHRLKSGGKQLSSGTRSIPQAWSDPSGCHLPTEQPQPRASPRVLTKTPGQTPLHLSRVTACPRAGPVPRLLARSLLPGLLDAEGPCPRTTTACHWGRTVAKWRVFSTGCGTVVLRGPRGPSASLCGHCRGGSPAGYSWAPLPVQPPGCCCACWLRDRCPRP